MVSAFWLPKTRPRSCSGSAQICLSDDVCGYAHFFCSPFFDDFCEEFIYDFTKKSLKKGDPGRHTTPTVTRFRGTFSRAVADGIFSNDIIIIIPC